VHYSDSNVEVGSENRLQLFSTIYCNFKTIGIHFNNFGTICYS